LYNPLILVIVLATILRLGYWLEIQDDPMTALTSENAVFDQQKYVSAARDIVAHDMLGTKVIWQSPAYPYLIAAVFKLFGENLNYLFLFQILWGIVSVYLLYQITLFLFDNQRMALLAAGLMAVYSPLIMYECVALRDLPIAYANVLVVYFLLRALRTGYQKYFLLAGFFTGWATVLRPGLLAMALLLYLWAVVRGGMKKKFIAVLLFVGGLMVLIVPLAVRNFTLGQKTLIEASSSSVFWSANAYDSTGIGYAHSAKEPELVQETQSRVWPTLKAWWREVQLHPKSYAQLYGRKLKMLFNGYEIPGNLSYDLARENSTVLKMAFGNFFFMAPLSILGIFLALPRFSSANLLYLFTAALSFFILMFQVEGRYRLGVVPFLIIFAAFSVHWAWEKFRCRQWGKLGIMGTVLVGLVLFTRPDEQVIAAYFGSRIRHIDYTNLGNAYYTRYEQKKSQITLEKQRVLLNKAIENYQKAYSISRRDEEKEELLEDIARMYIESGQPQSALNVCRQLVHIAPNHPRARTYIHLLENGVPIQFISPPSRKTSYKESS